MAPKRFTRTQLHFTDIHERYNTLLAAASTAEHNTPLVLPDVDINNGDHPDADHEYYHYGRGPDNRQIYDNCWYLHSHCTDDDPLDITTQHCVMSEKQLQNKQ
jgi:hypothetical protein